MSSRVGIGRRTRGSDEVGDPLDGLVNLFDIGIVLAVAALISAAGVLGTASSKAPRARSARSAPGGERARAIPAPPANGPRAHGSGRAVGTVYRLPDGRLVYVQRDGRRTTAPPAGGRP